MLLRASIMGGWELAESLHGPRERIRWAFGYPLAQAGWEVLHTISLRGTTYNFIGWNSGSHRHDCISPRWLREWLLAMLTPPIVFNSGGHAHLGMDYRGNGFAPMLKIGCSHLSWPTNDCRNKKRKLKVIKPSAVSCGSDAQTHLPNTASSSAR